MEPAGTLYGFIKKFIMDDNYGFEGMFRELNAHKIRKFEIMGAQMFRNYPNPAEDEIKEFMEASKKYQMEPFVYAGCVDRAKRPDRDMTDDEIMNEIVFDLMTAHKVGCKYLRGNGIPFHLYPRVAAMAGFYGIKVCRVIKSTDIECGNEVQEFIKMTDNLKTSWLGLAPELECFIRMDGSGCLADTEKLKEFLPYTAYFYGNLDFGEKERAAKTEAVRQIVEIIQQSGREMTVMMEYGNLSLMEDMF